MLPAEYSERAIYSVTSGILIDGEELPQHRIYSSTRKYLNLSYLSEYTSLFAGY